MEIQGQVKYSSRISAQSKRSHNSSCRSLERPNWSDHDRSINKNRSLIQVMSLEGSKKSDLYQKILTQDIKIIDYRKSNPINKIENKNNFNPFRSGFKIQIQQDKRFSYEDKNNINHICLCYLKCKKQICPCYIAFDQQCINDLCCNQCIELKKQYKKQTIIINKEKNQKIFCTCKKTKCNKKYCSCYAVGIKCGIDCTCQDCLNCDKRQKMEIEYVCIVDEQTKNKEMPQSMDFQPFSFRYSYDS